MGEINLDRLKTLSGEIRHAVRELEELKDLGRDRFLADSRAVNSAKYLFIVATEAALDICHHLVAKKGGRSPEDYADCIAILQEMGLLDKTLKERLMRMARFRNLLVHLYWKVDDVQVFRVMSENLGDFEDYLQTIGRYLKTVI